MTPDWLRDMDRELDEFMHAKRFVAHTLGAPLEARRASEARETAAVSYADWHRVLLERDDLRAAVERWKDRCWLLLVVATFLALALSATHFVS